MQEPLRVLVAGSGDVNAFIVYFLCDRTVLYNPTRLVVE